MEYREVISYLYDMLPMYQRIGSAAFKKDLTNTKKLCRHLGHPESSFRSVHVAGTNGKGSSSHMIANILTKAGFKTGLYTSPHLRHFSERIKINGKPVTEDYIVTFVESMQPVIEKINPSFFELTVAMAFDYFAREKVDFAVIEVGLGGRLDSTNVIRPEVSLITNISYDHMEMLGETLEKIAFEKAGIIKKQVPVVIGEKDGVPYDVFDKAARRRKAPIIYAADQYEAKSLIKKDRSQDIAVRVLDTDEIIRLILDTPDLTQLKNIPGVLAVVEVLRSQGVDVSQMDVEAGLRNYQRETGLKGRWQILRNKPLTIADVAHNKGGLETALSQLLTMKCQKLHFILGFAKEKDISNILPLFPKDASYTFCQANVPRAMDAQWLGLQAALFNLDGLVIPDVNQALNHVMKVAGEKDVVFIGGSTFVVAEIKDL